MGLSLITLTTDFGTRDPYVADEVRLTGMELHSVEGVSAEGRTVEGEVIELSFVATELARSFMIEIPRLLPPGEYFLIWRCIATDSHFSTGEFFFTVVDR